MKYSPGWYPDPEGSRGLRYHDGTEWTNSVHPVVSAGSPPSTSGWFPDPLNLSRSRYFDGRQWTDSVRRDSLQDTATAAHANRNEEPVVSGSKGPHSPGVPRWLWFAGGALGVAIVSAVVMGTALVVNLINEPTTYFPAAPSTMAAPQSSDEAPRSAASTTDEPTPSVPDPVEDTLSDTDIMDILARVMPDWLLRATAPNPGSNALASWISESQDPAAAAGGNFIAVLVYESSADSATSSEEAILDQIFTDFQFYYPYQQWVRMRCANTVVFVADLGADFVVAEMPSSVSCREF